MTAARHWRAGLSLGVLWSAFFAYAALAAALVQLVLLPYVMPAWHGGNGLLAGGDWLAFHSYGVALARRIYEHGWATFELRPSGMAPAGIAGAIYALTVPQPWSLIPLNAALHATAGVLLLRLVELLLPDRRRALVSVLPFLLSPTALTWVTQIHKDGVFVTGYFCLLYGGARLAAAAPAGGAGPAGALILLSLGFVLIWVVRPEHVWPIQVLAAVPAAIVVGTWFVRAARSPGDRRRAAVVVALVVAATLAPAWLPQPTPAGQPARAGAAGPLSGRRESDERWYDWEPRRGVHAIPWYVTPWLPAPVDRAAYRLALIREQFLMNYIDSRTNLDVEVGFRRAGDLLRYVPRALQIALWAPFPVHWGEAGSLAWTSTARWIVSLEMLVVYAAMVGLPVAMWRWRRRPELGVVLVGCLLPLVLYALAVPNLGALHRFRYGFLMPLVTLGLAGWLAGWRGPACGR